MTNPQVVVVVVINDPGGDLYHGGDVAAPVFSRIMQGALRVLNIMPDGTENIASHITLPATKNDKNTLRKEVNDA